MPNSGRTYNYLLPGPHTRCTFGLPFFQDGAKVYKGLFLHGRTFIRKNNVADHMADKSVGVISIVLVRGLLLFQWRGLQQA